MNEYDYFTRDNGILDLITAPVVEPIGLDEVKSHSRITIDDDDIDIQEKICSMRLMIERAYNLAFITQTWTLSLRRFDSEIKIYKRPVQSITKIEYLVNGVLTTLATTVYEADLKNRPPCIRLIRGQGWPSLADDRRGSVVITFKAGYGDTANTVPFHLKQYLLIKVADTYENRESYTSETRSPVDFVENLIASERLYTT